MFLGSTINDDDFRFPFFPANKALRVNMKCLG